MILMEAVAVGTDDDIEALAAGAMHGAKERLFVPRAAPAGLDRDGSPVRQREACDVDRIRPRMFRQTLVRLAVARAAGIAAIAGDAHDFGAEVAARGGADAVMHPAEQRFGDRAGHGFEAADRHADVEQLNAIVIAALSVGMRRKFPVFQALDAVQPGETRGGAVRPVGRCRLHRGLSARARGGGERGKDGGNSDDSHFACLAAANDCLNPRILIDNHLQQVTTLINTRGFFWLPLALPGAAMLHGYVTGQSDAMDLLDPTGETSARLLIAALMITPLLLLTKNAPWVRWLLVRRRYIGIAAFGYALMHLGFYLIDMASLAAVLSEVWLPGIWTGWAALILLLVMAAISNDTAMRRLKAGWKRLQRLAYPAAVLTLIHWVVVHDGFIAALAHVLPLALLELYRLFHISRKVSHHA